MPKVIVDYVCWRYEGYVSSGWGNDIYKRRLPIEVLQYSVDCYGKPYLADFILKPPITLNVLWQLYKDGYAIAWKYRMQKQW